MGASRDEHDAGTVRVLSLETATGTAAAPFGVLLGPEVPNPGLPIPYYRSSVVEGEPLPFACGGEAVIRTAQIAPRGGEVEWLERHLDLTQAFVGLGGAPFVLVVAPPSHTRGLSLPALDELVALFFPPGHGLLLHAGTWHEFPFAISEPVTVLTLNSRDVVTTLASADDAAELDCGDVRKIRVRERLGTRVEVSFVGAPRA